MSAVWAVPCVVLLVGAAIVAFLLRDTRSAVDDLRAEVVRFGEVRLAVAQVRAEAARTRDTLEALRGR